MNFGPTEPWGLWQSEQDILPSGIGWCEGLLTCVRCSLWQAKHTSDWASLSRTLSCPVWTWWHAVQVTSRLWCVLPAQCERFASLWWHARHCPFCASGGDLWLPRKSTSGRGRSVTPSGLCTWRSLSPWQLVHEGVRPSAFTPWRVCPMASTGNASLSSWQRVHWASPRRTRSLRSCATASVEFPNSSIPASAASASRMWRGLFIFASPSLVELDFRRSGARGLLVRDAEMAVDAGLAFRHAPGVPGLRLLRLEIQVHLFALVAVAALERVRLLHALPDALREHRAVLLEFLGRVDHPGEVAPALERRADLAFDEGHGLARHVEIGADRAHAGA